MTTNLFTAAQDWLLGQGYQPAFPRCYSKNPALRGLIIEVTGQGSHLYIRAMDSLNDWDDLPRIRCAMLADFQAIVFNFERIAE